MADLAKELEALEAQYKALEKQDEEADKNEASELAELEKSIENLKKESAGIKVKEELTLAAIREMHAGNFVEKVLKVDMAKACTLMADAGKACASREPSALQTAFETVMGKQVMQMIETQCEKPLKDANIEFKTGEICSQLKEPYLKLIEDQNKFSK